MTSSQSWLKQLQKNFLNEFLYVLQNCNLKYYWLFEKYKKLESKNETAFLKRNIHTMLCNIIIALPLGKGILFYNENVYTVMGFNLSGREG